MSQTVQQPVDMTPEDAAFSADTVVKCAMVDQLRSRGYPVQTEEQLDNAVKMALHLQTAVQQGTFKQAAVSNDPFAAGLQTLQTHVPVGASFDDCKVAADQLMRETPDLLTAALMHVQAEAAAQGID